MIPYGRQSISQSDIDAVCTVLQSDYLTQGPAVVRFEEAVASYLGASTSLYAVAMNSATSALHIACLALDVGPGDIVWTCANSFAASANCALYCGALVDFVDIDPQTLNMDMNALEQKLIRAKALGQLPKVVIPIDFAGRSAELRTLRSLADRFEFAILEDASHAIGAHHEGVKVGAHGFSDITVFSFHPVKIITTAEGGMAITHRKEIAVKLQMLRSHGITRDPDQLIDQYQGSWYYEQQALGYNYRMTDLHAALGLSQLKRIESFVARRHQIYASYQSLLQSCSDEGLLVLPQPDSTGSRSALHLYPIRLGPACRRTRLDVFQAMRAAGIGVNVHYIPIYWHPYYRAMGFAHGLCPHAEAYYLSALSLPMHAEFSTAEQAIVVNTLVASLR